MTVSAGCSGVPAATDRIARLCALVGARHPIIQGGMTSVGTARLAAAVSQAGGLGLVSAGRLSVAEFDREMAAAAALTDRPLGVNIPITRDIEWMEAALAAALQQPMRFVFMGGGNPAPWANRVLAAGRKLAVVVSSPAQARKAEALGASLVVAEGMESGGKAGFDEIGLMALVPAVVDAVSIPVVAAGGIADGRGAAAAICLGAAGVQLGTRFMMSAESPIHPAAKAELVDAAVNHTLVVGRGHGLTRRVFRNQAVRGVIEREKSADLSEMLDLLSGARSVRGLLQGDIEDGMIACGQGVGLIGSVEPAAAIIDAIVVGMLRAATDMSRALQVPVTTDGSPGDV